MSLKKKLMAALVVVLVAVLGAFAARANDTRTIKMEKPDVLALSELARRGGELEAVRKQWQEQKALLDADTAEVMSAVRARYKLEEGESIVSCDMQKGTMTVARGRAGAPPQGGK